MVKRFKVRGFYSLQKSFMSLAFHWIPFITSSLYNSLHFIIFEFNERLMVIQSLFNRPSRVLSLRPSLLTSHPQGEGNEVTRRTRSGRTGTVSDRTPKGPWSEVTTSQASSWVNLPSFTSSLWSVSGYFGPWFSCHLVSFTRGPPSPVSHSVPPGAPWAVRRVRGRSPAPSGSLTVGHFLTLSSLRSGVSRRRRTKWEDDRRSDRRYEESDRRVRRWREWGLHRQDSYDSRTRLTVSFLHSRSLRTRSPWPVILRIRPTAGGHDGSGKGAGYSINLVSSPYHSPTLITRLRRP